MTSGIGKLFIVKIPLQNTNTNLRALTEKQCDNNINTYFFFFRTANVCQDFTTTVMFYAITEYLTLVHRLL